jgi:hypothetical protein
LYVAWETESPAGDPLAEEVFMARVVRNPQDPFAPTYDAEEPLQTTATRTGSQLNPRLAASSLFPGGAMLATWEDWSPVGSDGPSLMLDFRPSPFVSLGP